MMPPNKILLISGFRIFPGNTGGHLRSGNIVRSLARMGHEVCVYSLAGRSGDYSFRSLLPPTFRIDQIEINVVEETHLGLGIGLLQALGRRLNVPRVWQYMLLRLNCVPSRLRKRIREADVVISDLPWCPPVGKLYRKKPWYLLSHNLEYRLLEQGKWLERLSAKWMKRVESGVPDCYRDVLACAEEDNLFFKRHDSKNRMIVPIVRNGVDPAQYVTSQETRSRVRRELELADDAWVFVFTGSNFAPNVEALERLKAFAQLHEQFLRDQKIVFLAVGSMSREPFKVGSLIATGRVHDVIPYFSAADVALNPISRGSGSNVKLFEYLAARLPVMSTGFGVRGTSLVPDDDYCPFEFDAFTEALQKFVGERAREQWRARAERVWERHRGDCDIEIIMRDVAKLLPDFANPNMVSVSSIANLGN